MIYKIKDDSNFYHGCGWGIGLIDGDTVINGYYTSYAGDLDVAGFAKWFKKHYNPDSDYGLVYGCFSCRELVSIDGIPAKAKELNDDFLVEIEDIPDVKKALIL